jgi:LysM repeat protein
MTKKMKFSRVYPIALLLTLTVCLGEANGGKQKKYTVKRGDSIARIADFHGVSQNDLRQANDLKKSVPVRVGQILAIPTALRGDAIKSHTLKKGDTLFAIAKKYGVSVKALSIANKLRDSTRLKLGRTLIIPADDERIAAYKPRKPKNLVTSGRKVKGGVRHRIQPGQSLWIIARAYNVNGASISKANGFSTNTLLRVGQEIFIPRATAVVPVRVKGFAAQPIRFFRVRNNKSATLRLLTHTGKINKRSRIVLSRLAGPVRAPRRARLLHPRLIHMIQRVAERYPGRTIEIISGFRHRKKGARVSKHNVGRALDFRVVGIPRAQLYDFIRQLPKTGAGYYPNSVFIHMDVRDKRTVWTDLSGPGEAANYFKKGQKWNAETEANNLESEETNIFESEAETKTLDDDEKIVDEE